MIPNSVINNQRLVSRVVCSHRQSNATIAKDVDKSGRMDAFYGWSPDGKQFALSRGAETRDVVLMRNFR